MIKHHSIAAVITAAILSLAACASSSALPPGPDIIPVWEGTLPSARRLPSPESQTVKDLGWRSIIEIHNVSEPAMTVVRPPAGRANGSAMLVLPGGAFSILAWDLEGTEVANFLAERGVTAFILKYSVSDPTPEQIQAFAEKMRDPRNAADPAFFVKQLVSKSEVAVDDALQAMRLVRAWAAQYGIDRNRIGMIGFSAGAITTFGVLQRADDETRPNMAAPIYGLSFEPEAPSKAPPLFMAVAKDDLLMAAASADVQRAWEAAGKVSELYVFESGEHGFGMGRPGTDSMRFGPLLETWLRQQGFLK